MQRFSLPHSASSPFRILCLGAHSDDIEIGAGGTILTLLQRHPRTDVHWVVFGAPQQRGDEARASAAGFLDAAREARVTVHGFRDGYFPAEFVPLKDAFEALKREFEPDLILTHQRADHHQDHRIIAELTWNTYRDHLILGYEIPKYDPDLGNPNVFMPLEEDIAERKVAALMEHFASQRSKRWFTPETFRGLMRLRGVQAAAPSGLAEGLFGPKLWL
jgi:LmbE family N-acetylglucosaminyl deacetylase